MISVATVDLGPCTMSKNLESVWLPSLVQNQGVWVSKINL